MDSAETMYVMAPYAASTCPVLKIDTSTGTISLQKEIVGFYQCRSAAISSDNQYIYVSGVTATNPSIVQLNFADLSARSAMHVTVGTLYNIYSSSPSASTYKVLLGAEDPSMGYIQIAYLDFTAATGTSTWTNQIS